MRTKNRVFEKMVQGKVDAKELHYISRFISKQLARAKKDMELIGMFFELAAADFKPFQEFKEKYGKQFKEPEVSEIVREKWILALKRNEVNSKQVSLINDYLSSKIHLDKIDLKLEELFNNFVITGDMRILKIIEENS